MVEATIITIEDTTRNRPLAQATLGEGVLVHEGSYYYAPELVDKAHLIVTDRIYTCPYKGICYWIDLRGSNGKIYKEVGWVYPNPKPGYEFIKDRIAFYPGIRSGTTVKLEIQHIGDQVSMERRSLSASR